MLKFALALNGCRAAGAISRTGTRGKDVLTLAKEMLRILALCGLVNL